MTGDYVGIKRGGFQLLAICGDLKIAVCKQCGFDKYIPLHLHMRSEALHSPCTVTGRVRGVVLPRGPAGAACEVFVACFGLDSDSQGPQSHQTSSKNRRAI